VEFSEIILALVGIVSTISAWVVTNLVSDVKALNDKMTTCQTSMPKEYVLKSDYKLEISELKGMITSQSKKIDQIWKHMRIDHG